MKFGLAVFLKSGLPLKSKVAPRPPGTGWSSSPKLPPIVCCGKGIIGLLGVSGNGEAVAGNGVGAGSLIGGEFGKTRPLILSWIARKREADDAVFAEESRPPEI